MNHGKTGAEVEIIALGRDAFSPVWNPSRKNSRLTLGRLRSNDDTIRLFARRIAAFSVLLVDDGCAQKQTVSSRTQRLRIICRMLLLDTSRLSSIATVGRASDGRVTISPARRIQCIPQLLLSGPLPSRPSGESHPLKSSAFSRRTDTSTMVRSNDPTIGSATWPI